MARCDQNERLLEHGTKAAILGGTVYKAGHGCDKKQGFGDENCRWVIGCVVWNVIRKI